VRRILIALLLGSFVGVAVLSALLVRPGHGSAESPGYGAAPQSTFDMDQARAFPAWALYNEGDSFQGQGLAAILRTKVTNPFDPEVTLIRPNYVSFIYGDCLAEDDQGCAPPLEIQISPACLFTPAVIALPDSGRTTVRGVQGTFYEDGAKLILVTGRSTISIFGHSRDQVVAAAKGLRGINNAVAVGAPLPPAAVAETGGGPTC
jgi:hypothetical protein